MNGMISAASAQLSPKTNGISLGLTAANVAKIKVPAIAVRRTVRKMIGPMASPRASTFAIAGKPTTKSELNASVGSWKMRFVNVQMPSETDAGDETDHDVESLFAGDKGVPAGLELHAESQQAAVPAPTAQRRRLESNAQPIDEHRRDERLRHRAAGESPDARAEHDGHDGQRLRDHLRSGVGGELPVVSHRAREGDSSWCLQCRDRAAT